MTQLVGNPSLKIKPSPASMCHSMLVAGKAQDSSSSSSSRARCKKEARHSFGCQKSRSHMHRDTVQLEFHASRYFTVLPPRLAPFNYDIASWGLGASWATPLRGQRFSTLPHVMHCCFDPYVQKQHHVTHLPKYACAHMPRPADMQAF